MKTKRILVAILLLVLVCAILVACNDKAADEYVGVIKGDASRGWKPTAVPDPNNSFDKRGERTNFSEGTWNFDGTAINIWFTNTESLNNLFYDYTLDDFDKEKFKRVEEGLAFRLSEVRECVASYGYDSKKAKEYNRTLRLELVNPTKENAVKYAEEFYYDKGIRSSEPELYGSWFITSNDPSLTNQWGLEKIKAYDAWGITTGSSSVTVGHLDSGINNTHPDLANNVMAGGYAADSENPNSDTAGHGTTTAGVIGAVGNNAIGGSGVCWNVNIVSLKVGKGSSDEIPQLVIEAINYAKSHNIKLLNFSGGFYESGIGQYQEELKNAIQAYNGLIVVAAGNSNYNIVAENGSGTKLYPQSFDLDNILVVGATDSNDNKSDFSNYGQTTVDLFAPGNSIYTTYSYHNSGTVYNTYGSFSGTSLAAPFVTGVAALLLSMEPNLTAAQLKARIMQNVDAVPALSNLCVSGGRLNAKKAVDAHGHDSLYTCNYSSNGVRRGHSVSCNYCDYTGTEAHEWSPVKVPNTAIVKYHICKKCRAKTEIMEIPNPSFLLSPSVLALINEQESAMSGDFEIEITKDVAIVKKNGKYYLMIACDDKGRRLADLSKILKR